MLRFGLRSPSDRFGGDRSSIGMRGSGPLICLSHDNCRDISDGGSGRGRVLFLHGDVLGGCRCDLRFASVFEEFGFPVPTNTIFDPIDVMGYYSVEVLEICQTGDRVTGCGTIGGDICLVGHEDDVVEIVQKVDDIIDAVFGSVFWACVAYKLNLVEGR